VVEGAALEKRCAPLKGTEGSNPSLSAKGGSHGRKLMAISLLNEKDLNTGFGVVKPRTGAGSEHG
jgi:hypothetical protein